MGLMYDGAIQNAIDAFAQLPGIGPKGAQRIAFYLLTAPNKQVQSLVNSVSVLKEKVRFCRICGNVTESDVCVVCIDPRRDRSTICIVEEPKDVMAIERTGQFRGLYHVLGGAINPMADIGPSDLRIKELLQRLHGDEFSHKEIREAGEIQETEVSKKIEETSVNVHTEVDAKSIFAENSSVTNEVLDENASSDASSTNTSSSIMVEEVILALNPNIEGEATATYLTNLLQLSHIKVTRLASGLPVGSDLEYADEITLGRALAGRRSV